MTAPRIPGPPAPGSNDDLDRLFQQYGQPIATPSTTGSAGARDVSTSRPRTTAPGDDLDALFASYGHPAAVTSGSGDIDLREPSRPAPATPRGPSVTTLEGALPGAIRSVEPTSAVSVHIPELTQPNGSPQFAFRNNNPGNLKYAGQPGAESGDGGFARFASPEDGYKALVAQIGTDSSRGHTLASFISKFAPPDENDTSGYITRVSKALNADPATPLSQLDSQQLARAIANHESSSVVAESPAAPPSQATPPPRRLAGPAVVADATRVGAEPSAHAQNSMLERVAMFPFQVAAGAVQHPIDFVAAPAKAAVTALSPGVGEARPDARLSKGGNSTGAPITTAPYDAEHGGVTPSERAIASAQALSAVAAPIISAGVGAVARPVLGAASDLLGHMAAAASAGAAYTPDDPVVGAFGAMLLGIPHPEMTHAVSRAVDAGQSKVAGLLDAARQADADATAQGHADARQQFNTIVAKVLPTLAPNELAYLQSDPVLGPLSRDALQQAGVRASTPRVDATAGADLDRQFRETPQTEPDQSLADALRSQPRTRDVFPGSERLPPQATADVSDLDRRRIDRGGQSADPSLVAENARQEAATEQQIRHYNFPITSEHLLAHVEAKGGTIADAATALRAAGYNVTNDIEREAVKSQMLRGGSGDDLPARDEWGRLVESFDDQRNRMIAGLPRDAGDELERLYEEHGRASQPAARPAIPSVQGRDTRVLLRDGQALPAEYHLVSADDVVSSHDPFSFNPTQAYPQDVQGRDYHRNKAAQTAVERHALDFNADIALNPSESAGEGVPTLLPNGVVLAGNERSMLPRRAAVHAPEKYAAYLEQLKTRAAEFGIDPADVDRVRSPMLVRILTDAPDVAGGPARWAEINRLSDEASTKAKSSVEESAARAAKLASANDALDHLANTLHPDQTIAEYLGTPDGRTFVRHLQHEQVITPEEYSRFADARGGLTEDGRTAIRRMLLSTAVPDPSVLLDAPAGAASKIEHAVPAIVSVKGTAFDLTELTTEALRTLAEARDHGMTVKDLASQGGFFGESERDASVTQLAEFLDSSRAAAVKTAYRRYAALAREALGRAESTDMFGSTGLETPAAIFADAFGATQPTARVASRGPSSHALELDALHAQYGAESPDVRPDVGARPQPRRSAAEAIASARAPAETSGGRALGEERPSSTQPDAAASVNRFADSLRKLFAPASRGEEARMAALMTREHDAGLAHRYEQAKTALREFGRMMDGLPVAQQLNFIDRLEHGRPQATPELTRAAQLIRQLLDDARDQIRALGEGQLEHWIENYFPHIWTDSARAKSIIASIMGKRSMTGPASFLKRRAIPTVREGIDAGLSPVTFNPVDLTLLKLREMHRYLAGQRIIGELKSNNLLHFVNSFEKGPAGFQLINDKLSTVYGPPKVTVVEAFDHLVRSKLETVMRELGVRHERRPNIGGGSDGGVRLGYAQGTNITTRSATPESVIEHELGHALDAKLGLWNRLFQYAGDAKSKEAVAYRKAVTVELRSLADLRHEGIPSDQIPQAQHEYVRSRPEKVANAVMGLVYAPDRMRQVAPTVFGRLREVLSEDPTTAKILDIKPSFRHGASTFDVRTPGRVILGHWYAPEPVARVLNNYLSPGISETAIGPFFDVYRGLGNILNMVQLGFSGFHLMFTSLDAAVSKNALGVLQLREGHPLDAAKSFASAPVAPVTTAMKGLQVRRAYLRGTTDPALGQIVDGLEAAGGRVRMDEFYGGNAWRQFRLALHESRYGTAAAKVLPGVIEQSSAWLMQHVVPLQKLGVFHDLAQLELARLPAGADRTTVRAAMARAWDSVENRMGQLTYSNLFWHRWLKDGLMASVRSVGWNIGTVRELGGGTMDLVSMAKQTPGAGRFAITPRASYVIALPLTVGLFGGVLQWLYTGQVPSSLKDWYYPRTGQKNPDGSDERVQPASYMRDLRGVATHPWETLKGKLSPQTSAVYEMLQNEDYFRDKIRNPDDPIVQQLGQEVAYIIHQATPLGVQNLRTQMARGEPAGKAAENLIGITPAPRAVVRSAAMNRMHDLLTAHGTGGLTPEEVAHRDERSDMLGRLRTKAAEGPSDVGRAIQSGEISIDAAKHTMRAAALSPVAAQFDRLTLPQAIEVYKLATPDERRELTPTLVRKLNTLSPSRYRAPDLDRIRQGVQALPRLIPPAGVHP